MDGQAVKLQAQVGKGSRACRELVETAIQIPIVRRPSRVERQSVLKPVKLVKLVKLQRVNISSALLVHGCEGLCQTGLDCGAPATSRARAEALRPNKAAQGPKA